MAFRNGQIFKRSSAFPSSRNGEGDGHSLRKDTCAALGIAGKCVGRDGQGGVGVLHTILCCSGGPGMCEGNVGDGA